jgi:hypothetical protein
MNRCATSSSTQKKRATLLQTVSRRSEIDTSHPQLRPVTGDECSTPGLALASSQNSTGLSRMKGQVGSGESPEARLSRRMSLRCYFRPRRPSKVVEGLSFLPCSFRCPQLALLFSCKNIGHRTLFVIPWDQFGVWKLLFWCLSVYSLGRGVWRSSVLLVSIYRSYFLLFRHHCGPTGFATMLAHSYRFSGK